MVFGGANPAIPHTNTFLCLLFKFLNVDSKCNFKGGNSKFMALRSKKTLLMTLIMSPSMLDLGCFVSFKLVFCLNCSFVVSLFSRLHHDCCVQKLHHLVQPYARYQSFEQLNHYKCLDEAS